MIDQLRHNDNPDRSPNWVRRVAIGVAGAAGCVALGSGLVALSANRTDARREAIANAVSPKIHDFKEVVVTYETPDHLTDNTVAVIGLQDGRTCRVEYAETDGDPSNIRLEYLGDCPRVTPAGQ